jgi:hypothetical protein
MGASVTEVAIGHTAIAGGTVALVFDTEDVESFNAPIDVIDIPCDEAGCRGCRASPATAGLTT